MMQRLSWLFALRTFLLASIFVVVSASAFAEAPETIVDMEVRGNGIVESDAILTMMKTRKGDVLNPELIRDDIRALYELGYFSDVRILKVPSGGGIKLIVQVAEKPSIVSIKFEGLNEVSEDDFKDKIETKLYTIVNEATITADLRLIEKQYVDKGYYLAKATYNLENKGANEVALTFVIEEGGKVQIGDVQILGNEYFTDAELISRLFSRPLTRSSALSGPGAMYQDDFVKRDLEILSFLYRDQGFQKVKVAKPLQILDADREFVRLTYQVEEGLQYKISTIDITGDVLFPKEELFELMKLKPGELFRFSHFQRDVEMLVDKYGDLGYAFVNVDPKTTYDDENKTAAINYEIVKGEKVYFGRFNIVGNSKTRDNVIRRELEVQDSDLYSGTGMTRSKQNVERLGFFEEVQSIRQRDEQDAALLNYKFKVKEKPTGQLQAALGFQPGTGTTQNNWFGQGSYREENQSGYGWKTNLTGKWNGDKNYLVEAGFTDPRVNDSLWSLGFTASLKNNAVPVTQDVELLERRVGGSVTLGRRIIEMLNGSITYRIEDVRQQLQEFLPPKFKEEGIYSSIILGMSRNSTNNYLDPTEGSSVSARQKFTGGPLLGGDYQFMESTFDASYYYPIDFSDTYRTNFRLHGLVSHIYPMSDQPIPFLERYRLGGYDDLRGFKYQTIGPHYNILYAPGEGSRAINIGGDKKLLLQLEYFMPVIPEAGIKAVVFGDAGRVYDERESLELNKFNYDFGFGFRWITPIAPFRFEWAYPIVDGKPGDLNFIFYLGY